MKVKGLRFPYKKSDGSWVKFTEILELITDATSLYWSILYLEGVGDLGDGKSIPEFEKQIYDSDKGLLISLDGLKALSKKYHQEYQWLIIGCKDLEQVHRYNDDYNMYESCDVVIELVDCAFWEVFSKDCTIIDELAKKFNKVKFLTLDSLKKELDETEAS